MPRDDAEEAREAAFSFCKEQDDPGLFSNSKNISRNTTNASTLTKTSTRSYNRYCSFKTKLPNESFEIDYIEEDEEEPINESEKFVKFFKKVQNTFGRRVKTRKEQLQRITEQVENERESVKSSLAAVNKSGL